MPAAGAYISMHDRWSTHPRPLPFLYSLLELMRSALDTSARRTNALALFPFSPSILLCSHPLQPFFFPFIL